METLKTNLIIISLCCVFAINAQTASWQSAFSRSYEYENASNYISAIKEVKNVFDGNDYFCNIRLGWLSYLAKNYIESIKYYEKAIQLKPYAIEARFGCIKPLSAIGNWKKVKENYLQILKIDPQNTTANYWLGVIYYNKKEYGSAANLFGKVINLYPLDYDSVIMLAWTKLYLGKMGDAKVLFNHALIIRPNDSSALSGLKAIK